MFRLTVDGDATGGWMVDVHDGKTNATYSPVGPQTEVEAALAALGTHFPELNKPQEPPAPANSDDPPQPPAA